MIPCVAVLAVFGLACLLWLAYGWLLLPGSCPIRAVVTASGSGEGLEQTVNGLLWLRKNRIWTGTVTIQDAGLNEEGLMLALTLARREGVEFGGKLPGFPIEEKNTQRL